MLQALNPAPVHVGPFEGAIEAASALARTRHVCLDLGPRGGTPPAMFLRAPSAIGLWTSTERDVPPAVESQLESAAAQGVTFGLYDVASFGRERLLEEVYFPLFVRFGYCTGAAPFKLNVDNFRQLAAPSALLAVASAGGTLVAGALLRGALPDDAEQCASPVPVHRRDVLELVAMGVVPLPAMGDDVFFFALLQMLACHGYQWIWIRETPWTTPARAAHWTRCADRASHIAYYPSERDCYRWNADILDAGGCVMFLESPSMSESLTCHILGRDRGAFAEARRALAIRGVVVNP